MPLSLASLAVAVGAIPGSRLMVAQKGSHVEDALEVLVAAKRLGWCWSVPTGAGRGGEPCGEARASGDRKREMPPAVAMNRAARRPPFQVGSG